MKKIAIITLQGLGNYGNRLQNYAVQQILRKYNYKPISIIPCHNVCKEFLKDIKTRGLSIFPQKRAYAKRYAFLRFNRKYIKCIRVNIFGKTFGQYINKKFDYVALGGDQVWRCWDKDEFLSGYYFGAMVKPKKRITISPSFGEDFVSENQKEFIRNQLMEIPELSVREESGAKIIKDLTDRNAAVVIDPVMALDTGEWLRIIGKIKKPNSPYTLACFLGGRNDSVENIVLKYSKSKDIKHFYDKNDSLYTASPEDFVSYIYNADLVCTNSFHCTIFAILFKKPFIIFDRPDLPKEQTTRLLNLLEKFNLSNRYIENLDCKNVYNIDYSQADRILASERKKFYEFLEKLL